DKLSSQLPADITSTSQTFTGSVVGKTDAASKSETQATSSDAAAGAVLRTKSNEAEDSSLPPGAIAEPSREHHPSPPSTDKDTIRLDTRLVNLNVKATDHA